MSNAVQENAIEEAGPTRFLNSPYSFTLREEIRKAAYSVKNFMYQGVIKDQSIPLPLITQAKGIAVRLSVLCPYQQLPPFARPHTCQCSSSP